MKNQFRYMVILVSVTLLFAVEYARSYTCEELFRNSQAAQAQPAQFSPVESGLAQATRLTLAEYAARATEESKSAKLPQFTTPHDEIADAQTWTGVKGPEVLQQMLPEGVLFVSHQLKGSNGDGLVKTASGNMVHLRGTVKGVGTNFGVSLGALKDNLRRSNKSLVREDADAVIVFVHGGGTKTTGHHVAASMMSYMATRNYDVVSLDMPWHAEGPRVSISSAKESLELMRDFIRQFISPSGKPVIVVGHSMGGMIADMYMRMYPNDSLVKAVVPLSTVADPMPGASVAQKLKVETEIAARNLTNPNIPEGERDLGEWLARQNKLSPTCGMFCQVLMYSIDWKKPKHGGSQYIPAFYIIGEADGLYQGYQQAFADGVGGLTNTKLKVISQRRDIKDKTGATMVPIGHLIFDHKPWIEFSEQLPEDVKISILNGTFKKAEWNDLNNKKQAPVDLVTYQRMKFAELKEAGLVKLEDGVELEDLGTPETFVLVRNFIADVIGKPAAKVQQDVSPLEAVAQAWANNLVFRQFAKSYIYLHPRATALGAQLGQEFNSLSTRISSIKSALVTQPQNQELKAEKERLEKRYAELSPIIKAKGEIDPAKKAEYDSIKKQYDNLNATSLNALNNLRKTLRQELVDLKTAMKTAEKFVMGNVKKFTSSRLQQLNEATEKSFALMMKQDQRVRELTDAYLSSGVGVDGRPPSMDRLPPNVVREFQKFDQLSQLYQKLLLKLNQQIIADAQAGTISAIDAADAVLVGQIVEKAQKIKGIVDRMREVFILLENSDKDYAQVSTQLFQLEIKMTRLVGAKHFTSEFYTIEQLLSGSKSLNLTPEEISSMLQKIWADWQRLWSTRIADTSDSLY